VEIVKRSFDHWRSVKQRLRRQFAACGPDVGQQEAFSRRIWERIFALPAVPAARMVMTYLDFRKEVCTRIFLPDLWQRGKTVLVPYCVDRDLELFLLESLDELVPGTWGILEPRPELRSVAGKQAAPQSIDLALIPGAAFDRRGGRLGRGQGFYDRFLPRLRPDALKVGLAFECQMAEDLPVTPQDVRMDLVLTEAHEYQGREEPKIRNEDREG
jgi:5-formyltetrahydrofolate cyclo-ligase